MKLVRKGITLLNYAEEKGSVEETNEFQGKFIIEL